MSKETLLEWIFAAQLVAGSSLILGAVAWFAVAMWFEVWLCWFRLREAKRQIKDEASTPKYPGA